VRVDLDQRKVPVREADLVQSFLDLFDGTERLARVGLFVVAVLDDQRSGRRAANVIDSFVRRLEDCFALVRDLSWAVHQETVVGA
jgi:hypothetical protein